MDALAQPSWNGGYPPQIQWRGAGGNPPLTQAIPSQSITMDGQPLGSDGNLWRAYGNAETHIVTPTVTGKNFYIFDQPSTTPFPVVHQTECTAMGDTNNSRTTIGIGELVDFSGMPDNTVWTVSGAGTLGGASGPRTILTASLSPGKATVTATVNSISISITFSVIAPSGIGNVSDYVDSPFNVPGVSEIGARTYFQFSIMPTNVSFANITVQEVIPQTPIHTWPSGHTSFGAAQTNVIPVGGGCAFWGYDKIADGTYPISWLFNGTSYADFSYSASWTDEYFNGSGTGVPFATVTTTINYRGSDQAAKQTYQNVSGQWQGPYP
jgi:hypothetical protein